MALHLESPAPSPPDLTVTRWTANYPARKRPQCSFLSPSLFPLVCEERFSCVEISPLLRVQRNVLFFSMKGKKHRMTCKLCYNVSISCVFFFKQALWYSHRVRLCAVSDSISLSFFFIVAWMCSPHSVGNCCKHAVIFTTLQLVRLDSAEVLRLFILAINNPS